MAWIRYNPTSKYWEEAVDETDPATLFTQLDVSAAAIVSGNLAVARMPLSGTWTLTDHLTVADYNVRAIEPVISTDVATKGYVDTAIQSLEIIEYFTNVGSSLGGSVLVMEETAPAAGTVTSAAVGNPSANDILVLEFATVAGEPNLTLLAAGLYETHNHIYFSYSGGAAKTCSVYWKLSKIDSTGGSEVLVMTSETKALTTSATPGEIYATLATAYTIPNLTDRFILRYYANVVGAGIATVQVKIDIGGVNNSHFGFEVPSSLLPHIFLPYSGANADTNTGAYHLTTTNLVVNGTGKFVTGISTYNGTPSDAGIVLPSKVPAATTNALYNDGGTLKFNGAAVVSADTVLTSGSYSNPAWITSLAGSKITGTAPIKMGTSTSATYPDAANTWKLAQSLTITGGTLATDGDQLRVLACIGTAANGNTKGWIVRFDPTGSDVDAVNASGAWNAAILFCDLVITRNSSTTGIIQGFYTIPSGGVYTNVASLITHTWSSDLGIYNYIIGVTSATDIVAYYIIGNLMRT